jgi:chemotaxis protein MotD
MTSSEQAADPDTSITTLAANTDETQLSQTASSQTTQGSLEQAAALTATTAVSDTTTQLRTETPGSPQNATADKAVRNGDPLPNTQIAAEGEGDLPETARPTQSEAATSQQAANNNTNNARTSADLLATSANSASNAQQTASPTLATNSGLTLQGLGETVRPSGVETTATQSGIQLSQQPATTQLAVQIAAQARAGNRQFNIRLDPPELGRVDIRLEINSDGQSVTRLVVEKSETLDLLQRDARQLERALQNAGLDSKEGSLSFSLRDDSRSSQGQQQQQNAYQNNAVIDDAEIETAIDTPTVRGSAGIDISI